MITSGENSPKKPDIFPLAEVPFTFETDFAVGSTEDILVKDVLDTLLLHVEFGDKLVTTPQGSLESHIDTCHYRVYPLLVQSGKADAGTQHRAVARS